MDFKTTTTYEQLKRDFVAAYHSPSRDYILERKTLKFMTNFEKPIIAVIIIGVAILVAHNFHFHV